MKKKGTLSTILLILVLLIGLSLLLYPSFSDYWNSLRQTRTINEYSEQVASLDTDKYEQVLNDAVAYNNSLLTRSDNYILTEEQQEIYKQQLNISVSDIMGYVEIPSIDCKLPIYHGTDEAVLQVGVGHIEWSSLPVGGKSTHCVISGHRGLPSAKLFSKMDRLVEGDIFMIGVLDEVLTYEVDQILIVEPDEVESLKIQKGKDLCTLVTCTPYGINTHRLLVRGHRIENTSSITKVRVMADAVQMEPLVVASVIIVPILMILLALVLAMERYKKRNK